MKLGPLRVDPRRLSNHPTPTETELTVAPLADPDFDVIVIGAGVLGTFHAYHAVCRGLRVLLIERGDWPGEASVRNFGTLVPSAMTPGVWRRRGDESVALWRELAAEVPLPLVEGGTQYLATTPGEQRLIEEFARLGPDRGYPCELLDAADSVRANPSINPDVCRGSLLFRSDARVESRRVFTALIPWLAARGCTYLPRTVATAIEAAANRVTVRTAAGAIFRASHAFVCGGADLRTLYPERIAAAGLRACKLLMYKTAPQPAGAMPITIASGLSMRWYSSFQIAPSWARLAIDEPLDPEIERWRVHVLMVQDADGGVIVGDSHEYSAGDFPDTLDMRVEALITGEAKRIARLSTWEVASRWAGVYALHPDKPVYRETVDGRVHLVTAIAGKGMTTGPAVARESLERALGVDGAIDGI